jgi:hypothetical protein
MYKKFLVLVVLPLTLLGLSPTTRNIDVSRWEINFGLVMIFLGSATMGWILIDTIIRGLRPPAR